MTRAQWALWTACVLAEVAAAILAALVARRSAAHRPVVAALFFAVAADLVMRATQALVLDGAARPLAGGARAVFHGQMALTTAWPLVVAALAWWCFVPASRRVVASLAPIAWGSLAAWMVWSHPLGRTRTAAVLQTVELAAVGVAALALMLGWARRRERPLAVAFALVAIELVVATIGPFVKGTPWDPAGDWDVARLLYLLGFACVASAHGFWLRSSSAAPG